MDNLINEVDLTPVALTDNVAERRTLEGNGKLAAELKHRAQERRSATS